MPQQEARAVSSAFLPYTAGSFYKSKATGLLVDQQRSSAFRVFMKANDPRDYPVIRGLPATGSGWGTPYADGRSTDPVWKLQIVNRQPENEILESVGFHAPAWFGDQLTGTSDSPFCVMDLASGFTVFGTGANVFGPNLISCATGGITWHSSNGLDNRNPLSSDTRNWTSRGRISDSMVIRRGRVDAAIAAGTGLGHVLHLFLWETNTGDGFCHPMVGCESGKTGFGAEGERVVIKPTVNLTTRGLSPFGLAIARTLKTHGAYIGDNAGAGGTSLKAEQDGPGNHPWAGLSVSKDALAGLTWDDFNVVQRGAQ